MTKLIVPQWSMPEGVAACSSTRVGGVSLSPYDSLNLGAHCGDNLQHVEENRRRMFAAGGLPSYPVWLGQFCDSMADRTSQSERMLRTAMCRGRSAR